MTQTKEDPRNEDPSRVAPRVALSPSGKLFFYDEKCKWIEEAKPRDRKDINEMLKGKVKAHSETVKINFYKNDCFVIIETRYGDYCFRVDCVTGEFLGLC